MADNNAPAPLIKPLVEAKPGDPITAGRWNEMQSLIRSEHIQHAHTGVWKGDLYDGSPITSAGLANGAVTTARIADKAVTGDKIDPAAKITVHDLTTTGTLKAAALDLAETDVLTLRCVDLKFGHSARRKTPGRALVDLASNDRQQLSLNHDSDWKDGVKICSDLQVTGNLTADKDATVAGSLTAKNGLTVTGTLTANNGLTVTGTATVGTLTASNGLTVGGAALTANNGLTVNNTFTANNGLTVHGAALTAKSGLTVSGAPLTASSGLAVAGSFTATGGLTVSGAPLTASNGLTVTGLTTLSHTNINGNLGTTNGAMLSVASGLYVGGALSIVGNATMKGRNVVTADADCGSPPRIIWGYIDESGAKIAGYGFTVETVTGPGVKIRFKTGFRELPAVIVQQHGSGKTTDNALVYSVNTVEATVYNGNNLGDKAMRAFFFMAIAGND